MPQLRNIPRSALKVTLLSGLVSGAVPALAASSDPFIGSIDFVGFNYAPLGWAHCDGQLLSISQNTALFSLFGTIYGGDGRTTFALPDLRGRAPIHEGTGPGLSPYNIGQKGGAETVTLNVNQLPPHTHTATTTVTLSDVTLRAQSGQASTATPGGNALAATGRNRTYSSAAPDVDMAPGSIEVAVESASTTIGSTGSNEPVENRSPYLALNCIVALQGIFPPRN
jgi:microcystin-dependent protein